MPKRKSDAGKSQHVVPKAGEAPADSPATGESNSRPVFDLDAPETLREAAELAAELAHHLREVREPLPHPQTSVPGDPLQSLGVAGVATVGLIIRLNRVLEIVPRLWSILAPGAFNHLGAEISFRDPAVLTLQTSFARIVAEWGWFNDLRNGHAPDYKRRFDPRNSRVPIAMIESLERASSAILGGLRRHEPSPTPDQDRDAWIHGECMKGVGFATIVRRLKTMPEEWSKIETINGIKHAANSHAARNGLPLLPSRQPGRPKGGKN